MSLANAMPCRQALELVASIVELYNSNTEEGLPFRVRADMSDEYIKTELGPNVDPLELEQALEARNVWQALETVNAILDQKGCEHFDPAIDGTLTGLCDLAIFG